MTDTSTEPRGHRESYECCDMKINVIHMYFNRQIIKLPPLLPQHHDDGELHGKLNNLYVEHCIGENKIISRNESALGYGINLAFTSMCNEYHTMIPDHENNLSSSDLLHNDSSFAGFTLNGAIKQGSITQCLSKDLDDASKEHLDRIYTQNEGENFHHNRERLS